MLRRSKNDRRSTLRQFCVIAFCLALMGYFGHHAMHGRHGLDARAKLIERAGLLEFEARSLEAQRGKLVRDVALLSPAVPHPDLVEELARDVLGYVKPDDVVILRPHS